MPTAGGLGLWLAALVMPLSLSSNSGGGAGGGSPSARLPAGLGGLEGMLLDLGLAGGTGAAGGEEGLPAPTDLVYPLYTLAEEVQKSVPGAARLPTANPVSNPATHLASLAWSPANPSVRVCGCGP